MRLRTIFLILRRLSTSRISGCTHGFVAAIQLLLKVVAYTIPKKAKDGFVHGGMDEELFIEENYHVLNGSQDLCLYPEGSVGLTELDQCSQYVLPTLRSDRHSISKGRTYHS